ncbi:MAG TPA: hypothetical protein VHG91_04960 [Longimicrobium sp.]|nr:hypothetical protein [Longimicrobium sp.]
MLFSHLSEPRRAAGPLPVPGLVPARAAATGPSGAPEGRAGHDFARVSVNAAPRMLQRQADGAGDAAAAAAEPAMSEAQRQEMSRRMCVGEAPGPGIDTTEFTPRERARLTAVRFAAEGVLGRAVQALGTGDPHLRRVARRILDVENADLSALAGTLSGIAGRLRSVPIQAGTCRDATCNGAAQAYVPNTLDRMIICPRFFLSSPVQQRRTLMHEAGHAAAVDDAPDYRHPRNCSERDSVDCDDPCNGVDGDRTRNVDALARFAECAAFT